LNENDRSNFFFCKCYRISKDISIILDIKLFCVPLTKSFSLTLDHTT
jgi:hypothetical protein